MSFNELVLDCYICGTQMKVLIPVDRKIHVEKEYCPSCKKVHNLKIQEGNYEFITEKEAQRLRLGLKRYKIEVPLCIIGGIIFIILIFIIALFDI